MPIPVKDTPANEHIFPASQLTPMAVRWKELVAAKRHKDAMLVLEQIIIGSTAMFERLAQYEDFHYTVDLPVLVGAAQEKVVKWLEAWNPKKGRLFSWFSRCAKNAFRSELGKMNRYRSHNHVTSDNLELFYGVEDHEVDKHDIAADYASQIKAMTCHWGDPQEIGAIRYIIDCVSDDEHDKNAIILGAAYAYGISIDLSKFFYSWALAGLRHTMYERAHIPFTQEDLFRAAHSYEHVYDLLDYMSWDNAKRLIARWQGMRIRFPTLAALAKIHENYQIFEEIEHSNLDPDSVAVVARRRHKTMRSAQEIYNEMTTMLHPKRTGEYAIYDED